MHARESRRIVVTGIGMWTPLGADRESSWRGLLAGQSAVRWLAPPFWADSTPIAGAPVCEPVNRRFAHPEPLVELALATAAEGLEHAGVDLPSLRERNVGIVFGTSKGGLHSFSKQMMQSRQDCSSASEPDSAERTTNWFDVFPNQPAMSIRRMIGGNGPVLCPIAACATGLVACLRGAELIQHGDCDIVLAGSADASLQPALLGSFRRLGVLSRETEDPVRACRPFDRHRSGFVIGEGAACLVLERLESAQSRGATAYAEWQGGGLLSDPFGLTQLDPDGTSLQRLLRDLRGSAARSPDYINLHGTGTTVNDRVESLAVRTVFGSLADRIDYSSLKGGLGHLLGAAGSVELAATVLAIRDQIVPPTVNLSDPDPECPLGITAQKSKSRRIDEAWKISMGFGGHIAGARLTRFKPQS